MQQRSLSSLRPTDDHFCIIISPRLEPQGRRSPPTRSMADDFTGGGLLPVSDPLSASAIRKRSDHNSRNKLAERWIHSIPLILLLILLILWWFSYPVNFVINDGGFRSNDVNELTGARKYIDHVELAGMQIASSPLNLTSVGARGLHIPSKVD